MMEGLPFLKSNLSAQTMEEKQDPYVGMVLAEQPQQSHLADLYVGIQQLPPSLQDKYCAVGVGGEHSNKDTELGSIITGMFIAGNHWRALRLRVLCAFTTAEAVQ